MITPPFFRKWPKHRSAFPPVECGEAIACLQGKRKKPKGSHNGQFTPTREGGDVGAMDAFVARQPIFNTNRAIVAYELLFRDGKSNAMPDIDGDTASSKVLSASHLGVGFGDITGGKRAFINFTERLLTNRIPELFPSNTTVIEVLESVSPSKAVVESCRKMVEKGYLLALDDFSDAPEWEPMVALAGILKIDFRTTPEARIRAIVERHTASPVAFLAEKIESYDEFRMAIQLGFTLFQGYFFCRPEVKKGRQIAGNRLHLLQITAEASREDVDIERMEALVQQDVGMSYRLLRYVNSAYHKRRFPIDTIRDALNMLGTDEIRRFLNLAAISGISDTKPRALVETSCIRGKFCEHMAHLAGRPELAGSLFTLGMFSLLDAILDSPMDKVISQLPLSPDIADALREQKGPLVPFLAMAAAYERGEWGRLTRLAALLGIPESDLPAKHHDASEWSRIMAAEVL